MNLYFVPSKLPRTMTRQEWTECYRWVRSTRKRLYQEHQKKIEDFIAFGSTMPESIRNDILDKMINPPLLMGPHMESA